MPLLRDVPGTGRRVDPATPAPARVVGRYRETDDVVTLWLEQAGQPPPRWRPGQFNMLTAFGVGEVAVSISGAPHEVGPVRHTVRDVGAVTHALCQARVGSFLGMRGPYGTDWGVDRADGADVVVVAGGIGLAPLRGAIWSLAGGSGADPAGRPRRLFVAVGARLPDQLLFRADLDAWREAGAEVGVTVDAAGPGWRGEVGVVTALLPGMGFAGPGTVALICGPEIMMRFVARELLQRGVSASDMRVSLERNVQCGVGLCGHCQLGPVIVCRDGPVFEYARVAALLTQRER